MMNLATNGMTTRDILTDNALRNAMTVHAACGGSTNLLLHIPAIAHAAKLRRPTVDDWHEINTRTPRLVDVLPNGPTDHPTVRFFLSGGVPEVMLHLRELGLLHLDCPDRVRQDHRRESGSVGTFGTPRTPARTPARTGRR